MTVFKNILRALWAAAGLIFIWFDIKAFGNTSLAPSFWLILGILAFFGALIGLTGGIGIALVAQGVLKYMQNASFLSGKIVFDPGFTLLDKVAHAFFIVYGIFLLSMQIKRTLKALKDRSEPVNQPFE